MKQNFGIKSSVIVEIISSLFILLYVYTAISKLSEVNSFKSVLSKSPLLGSLSVVAAWAIPLAELAIAGLLFLPRYRRVGLYGSLVLMSLFTLYLGYMLAFTPDLPCSCGGVLKQMTWGQHFVFNIFFTVLAFAGIVLERKKLKKDSNTGTTPVAFT